jgi:hypothetical protein
MIDAVRRYDGYPGFAYWRDRCPWGDGTDRWALMTSQLAYSTGFRADRTIAARVSPAAYKRNPWLDSGGSQHMLRTEMSGGEDGGVGLRWVSGHINATRSTN